jgi:ATP-dependent RNA helicase SUPV3L1/SUV3
MFASSSRPAVSAVLGPTNTGKTYLAIERMLDHETGMIGFPLRLLARENYDRVVRLRGERQVALVTGEEKIVPSTARYFLCTAESMPLERPVDFLAVDEIQMAADPERGHVFTDRLLRARGLRTTMFLGADTIRPLLQRLVPDADYISRTRLSRLTYSGPKKITRLPPRSAIVVFSANEVYEIAELIRHQRGGTAVVLGALSPRTRNAQVAMYQAGEVDYLVATDAIGMGLNMDIDHVAFAALHKFDGRSRRRLGAAEIAQIAGRAGRHMANGTFGTVSELGPLEPEIVEAVENHSFEPLKALQWRNADLDFTSVRALLRSLETAPKRPELMRARDADDQMALAALARDRDIVDRARSSAAVRLLWDVCQIPDFRKTMAEAHTRLLARIYRYLVEPEGRLPTDWVADQVARLDRIDGDIDTLMARIAHVRTWTYVSFRADWLEDAEHWRDRARAIEDRLSDALHARLTQRFVDRRAAALVRLKVRGDPVATLGGDGEVHLEGEYVGRLEGFRFVPDAAATLAERRTLMAASSRALQLEIGRRVSCVLGEPDAAFALDDDGGIVWRGKRIGRLRGGQTALAPRVEIGPNDQLEADQRRDLAERLGRWAEAQLAEVLAPLYRLSEASFTGAARGLAYRLVEALGSLPRRAARDLASGLAPADRRRLRECGVRFGLESIFVPALLKPRATRLRALLWAVRRGLPVAAMPPPGRVSVVPTEGVEADFYEACGYRVIGGHALRVDMLDRLALRLRKDTRSGPVALSPEHLSLVGLTAESAAPVVRALGYRSVDADGAVKFAPGRPREAAGARRRPRPRRPHVPDSPFAKLRELSTR